MCSSLPLCIYYILGKLFCVERQYFLHKHLFCFTNSEQLHSFAFTGTYKLFCYLKCCAQILEASNDSSIVGRRRASVLWEGLYGGICMFLFTPLHRKNREMCNFVTVGISFQVFKMETKPRFITKLCRPGRAGGGLPRPRGTPPLVRRKPDGVRWCAATQPRPSMGLGLFPDPSCFHEHL